jgi:hypothetical protein
MSLASFDCLREAFMRCLRVGAARGWMLAKLMDGEDDLDGKGSCSERPV